ncbi:hypothetical protein ACP4OV_021466 [Aristida adscensionis]
MEERGLRPKEPQGEGPTATATEAPSPPPPQVRPCSDDVSAAVSSGDETDGEFEFEFPFVSRDSLAGTAAPADELFADGRIRPFYPVFGRRGGGGGGGVGVGHDDTAQSAPATAARVRGQLGRLFLEESRARNSSTSSTASTASSCTSSSAATEDDDGGGLEGAPPESYCLWTPGSSASPSPRPPRKSSSTGSMARWRRISELVVGRSHSDGKEKFLFLPAQPPKETNHSDKPKHRPPNPSAGRKASLAAATEVDTVAAVHRTAYIAKGGGGGGVPGGTPRRTFLPYREELVGFFANVNGISRSHHHPF